MTMAQPVFLLEPRDKLHVLLSILATNEVFPLRDRTAVFGLDRWEIGRGTFHGICCQFTLQAAIGSVEKLVARTDAISQYVAAVGAS